MGENLTTETDGQLFINKQRIDTVRVDTLFSWLKRDAVGTSSLTSSGLGGVSQFKWGFDFRPGKVTGFRHDGSPHPDAFGHLETKGTKERKFAAVLMSNSELYEYRIKWRTLPYLLGHLYSIGVTGLCLVYLCAAAVAQSRLKESLLKVLRMTANKSPEEFAEAFPQPTGVFPPGFTEDPMIPSEEEESVVSQSEAQDEPDYPDTQSSDDEESNEPPAATEQVRFTETVREVHEFTEGGGQRPVLRPSQEPTVSYSAVTSTGSRVPDMDVAPGAGEALSEIFRKTSLTPGPVNLPAGEKTTPTLVSLGSVKDRPQRRPSEASTAGSVQPPEAQDEPMDYDEAMQGAGNVQTDQDPQATGGGGQGIIGNPANPNLYEVPMSPQGVTLGPRID